MITYLSSTSMGEAMDLDARVRGALVKKLLGYHAMVNGVHDDDEQDDDGPRGATTTINS